MRKRDFLGITESHGTKGSLKALRNPDGTRSWWSAGTSSRAGVGIIVSKTFLQQFPLSNWEDDDGPWEVIAPGRLAVLRLRGPDGNLDLWVAYMPTGTPRVDGLGPASSSLDNDRDIRRQRYDIREAWKNHLSPRSETLSVIMGDFNTVTRAVDRWGGSEASWNGSRDKVEEDHWRTTIADPFGLYELSQDSMTFQYPDHSGQSRLDRIYVNQDVTDQLDRRVGCASLEWTLNLSNHRALAFSREILPVKPPEERTIPDWVLKIPGWRIRTAQRFFLLLRSWETSNPPANSVKQLSLLRQAICEVAQEIKGDKLDSTAPIAREDEAGACMALLRAIERRNVKLALKWTKCFPALLEVIDPQDPRTWTSSNKAILRSRASRLSKEALLEDLLEFHNSPDNDSSIRSTRKSQITQKLKRLCPGQPSSIFGICDAKGVVHTDPDDMANALRLYWKDVFSSRRINPAVLERWLKDDANSDNPMANNLPDPSDLAWNLLPSHIGRAINNNNK